MLHKRPSKGRIGLVHWIMTVSTVGLLVAYSVGSFWTLRLSRTWRYDLGNGSSGGGDWTIFGFSYGAVMLNYSANAGSDRPLPPTTEYGWRWFLRRTGWHGVDVAPYASFRRGIIVTVPLWIPGIAAAAWAAWTWRAELRRRKDLGRCACGYSRAGIPEGSACPECGTTATAPTLASK